MISFDFQGVFVRTWCPELARLPNDYIHTPWLAPAHVLRDAGVELGVTYPRPLLIVPQWNQQVKKKKTNVSLFQYEKKMNVFLLVSKSTKIGTTNATTWSGFLL